MDKESSMTGVKRNVEGGILTGRRGCAGTAVSRSSSSSSYSIITLMESPDEIIAHGSLSNHPETVSVSAAQMLDSSETRQQLNYTAGYIRSDTSPSSAHGLSTFTSPAVADNMLTDCCNVGSTYSQDIAICIDHLELKVTIPQKSMLKITEHTAAMYFYTPSFPSLPAIVESCRSDDAQMSDASADSGDGYVADSGLVRSASGLSSASSSASLRNEAMSVECRDRQRETHVSDGAYFSVTSASNCSDYPLQSEGVSFTLSSTVTGGGQQLSAKSSSDGIDSAVVCTPYSSQTSQESANTVDNIIGSNCQPVTDTTDGQTLQLLPSAADAVHPFEWENDEMSLATVSAIADEATGHESVRQDSDDEISMASLKVEWEIGSDSEMVKHSEAHVINAPLSKCSVPFMRQPVPSTVSSFQSLMEQSRELEMHWSNKPAARRGCCACMSCVIMCQCVSTAADVVPTISVRICSSVVDVVCLIQRLVVACGTWLQVLCDSAFRLERTRNSQNFHSQDDQSSPDAAPSHPSYAGDAVCDVGLVCGDASVYDSSQHYSISEGLENIRESLLYQLIDVSNIRCCYLCHTVSELLYVNNTC